jgi:serine/threonine protein kinase
MQALNSYTNIRQAPPPPPAQMRDRQAEHLQVDPEELYVRQHRIGKGSFGEVYKGYEKKTTLPVAIKIIDLEAAEDEIEDIQLEIQILGQMDSEWVTR